MSLLFTATLCEGLFACSELSPPFRGSVIPALPCLSSHFLLRPRGWCSRARGRCPHSKATRLWLQLPRGSEQSSSLTPCGCPARLPTVLRPWCPRVFTVCLAPASRHPAAPARRPQSGSAPSSFPQGRTMEWGWGSATARLCAALPPGARAQGGGWEGQLASGWLPTLRGEATMGSLRPLDPCGVGFGSGGEGVRAGPQPGSAPVSPPAPSLPSPVPRKP